MVPADPRPRLAALAATGAVLLLYPFLMKDPFWQDLGVLLLVYASAAAAWNLLGGFAGQVSFGHSVFFGIGAYAVGFAVAKLDRSPWLGLAGGALLAALVGVLVGIPVFRLRSHYFAIATIAVQQVVYVALTNVPALGGGSGFPIPIKESGLATLQFSTRDLTPYHLLALALFGVTSLAIWLLLQGRSGLYLRAIRDDEEVARAMGVPVLRAKLYAIVVSAALTALAGGLYALYSLFVDPGVVLALSLSVQLVLMAVLGGAGTYWGPLLGAFVLLLVQSQTRIHLSGAGNALDLVIYGGLVVLVAVLEPAGLMGLGRRLWRRIARSPSGAAVEARL